MTDQTPSGEVTLSEADVRRIRGVVLEWLTEWWMLQDADGSLQDERETKEQAKKIAANLAPTVQRIVADRLTAERARYDDLVGKVRALADEWESSRGQYPPNPKYDAVMRMCLADLRALLAEAGEE